MRDVPVHSLTPGGSGASSFFAAEATSRISSFGSLTALFSSCASVTVDAIILNRDAYSAWRRAPALRFRSTTPMALGSVLVRSLLVSAFAASVSQSAAQGSGVSCRAHTSTESIPIGEPCEPSDGDGGALGSGSGSSCSTTCCRADCVADKLIDVPPAGCKSL